MTEPWVVDTNVGVVANDRLDDRPDPPHRPESITSCVSFLAELMRSGRVAIDDSWEIIREYQARMRSSGQPGPGDAFLKWVLVNQANSARCHRVGITAITVPGRLAGFDPADGKFIRTALAAARTRALPRQWMASGGSAAPISMLLASLLISSVPRKLRPTATASTAEAFQSRQGMPT